MANTMRLDGKDIVGIREMRIDDVDGGLPELTFDFTEWGGDVRTYALASDAVRAIVDALAGVAEPTPGEVRIVARVDARTLAEAMVMAQARMVKP